MVVGMTPITLEAIETAFLAAFSEDLCAEDDLPYWSSDNPARGHCAMAALTLNDLLGGDLLLATVDRDGVQVGYHYWNRLAGVDVDLTRAQFLPGEVVNAPEVVIRPPGRPTYYAEEYDTFRSRVGESLGIDIEERGKPRG